MTDETDEAPKRMTDEFLSAQKLPFTAYDTNYIYRQNKVEAGEVVPVTIIRHGCEQGCIAPSITVIDMNGRESDSNAAIFYATREDAQKQIDFVLAAQAEADFKESLPKKYSDLKEELKSVMVLLSETTKALGSEIYQTPKCPADSVFNRHVLRCAQAYIERDKEPQELQGSDLGEVDAPPAPQAPSA